MTREEAISWLTNEKWKNANNKYKKEWNEAFDMAIDALQTDAVSREAHYDAVANRITDMEERGFVSVVRCKDCRHYEDGMIGYCGELERGVSEDFYCYYGERGEK